MEAPLRIAFLAAEALPYAKAGGLGDVAGALPRALAARGQELRLLLPMHRAVRAAAPAATPAGEGRIPFQPAGAPAGYRAWEIEGGPGLRVIAIDIPAYFAREGIYTDPSTGEGYPDDGERFLAFTLAALDWLAGQGETIDLLHANDFHTGLAPLLLRVLGPAELPQGRDPRRRPGGDRQSPLRAGDRQRARVRARPGGGAGRTEAGRRGDPERHR